MDAQAGPVTVVRPRSGRPHAGKVLCVFSPHADDLPLYCAGLVAKLLSEGYVGYMVCMTNDERCGPTASPGETILQNEREVDAIASILGLRKVYRLGYRDCAMDEAQPMELRARLVFLIRLLKVDTVITFNPWGHGEENPDHYITGHAVEAARWMSGGDKDYPEHFDVPGLTPHTVSDSWYFVGRPGQPFNRVVDISRHMDVKCATLAANKAQGPAGSQGSRLLAELEKDGLTLPEIANDPAGPDVAYIRMFALAPYASMGRKFGVEYAERFYYVAPGYGGGGGGQPVRPTVVTEYIRRHAVRSSRM